VSVAQEACDGDFLHRQRFGFLLCTVRFRFFAQGIDSGDAQNVTVQLPCQVVVLQHDVECLIPRHVIQNDG